MIWSSLNLAGVNLIGSGVVVVVVVETETPQQRGYMVNFKVVFMPCCVWGMGYEGIAIKQGNGSIYMCLVQWAVLVLLT